MNHDDQLIPLSRLPLAELLAWFEQFPPSLPYRALAGVPRVVTGIVNSDASTNAGTGWSAAHTATGVYTITLDVGFSADPLVLACLDSGAAAARIKANATAQDTIVVKTYDGSGVATDSKFSFTAQVPV